MCGIIAIVDKNNEVVDTIVTGLMSLQHRGQDACGIITNVGDEFFVKKEMGSVDNVFNSKDNTSLKGKMGLGHTRYATQGKVILDDAQPLSSKTNPKIAIAHNGNLTNYFEIKEELEKDGIHLHTSIDSEVILRIFAEDYDIHGDFFKAAKAVIEKLKGAYSIVGMIENKGIFAFRDPHGVRPLVLGKYKDSYALASETVAFQVTDYEYVRDIEPGEAIFITKDMKIESTIIKQEKKAHCMFEWVYFASPNSMIEGRSVYKSRLALGGLLSKSVNKENVDVVVPVPDSGRTCAIKLSEDLGTKYREGLIKNKNIQRTFIMSNQKQRKESVRKKLMPIISILENKNVAVVDDSIVRGTTSKRIIEALRKGDVKKITFVSSCPPIKYPCYYGVDFATKKELIASNRSVEEIRDYLEADDVVYATLSDVKNAIRRDLCMACLDGNYPEKITDAQKQCLGCQRSEEQTTLDNINDCNVVIIGGGGREHALALKVAESTHLNKLYAIPGNPGMAKIAECHDLDIMDNNAIVNFAKEKNIDLVIIGPEAPLVNGMADELELNEIRAFGPGKLASQFEGSKAFSRKFMKKYNLPTVEFGEFTSFADAKDYIKEKGAPIVVKADGLAAGKGVLVAKTDQEAINFVEECLKDNKFKDASSKVIVEECLFGEEASYLVFMDSKTFKPMVYSQDHKPIFEGDKGPNCYSSDTEILTEKGWKTFDKLKKEEKVMTFDPKEKVLSFKKPTKIHWMKHDGKMIHFKHRELDLLVTPNHRMLVKRRKINRIKVIEAENLKGENEVFLSGIWKGKSLTYYNIERFDYKFNRILKKQRIRFLDWIQFMGLFLSEGYVTDTKTEHRVYVCQTRKSKHFRDFERILSKLPFKFSYNEKNSKFRINSVQLCRILKQFGTSRKKYIPDYIKDAKKEHIFEFLKAFALGDGDIHYGRIRFHSGSKKLIDDIQELVLKIGKSGIITVDKREKMLNPINKKYYKANKVYALEIKPEMRVGIRKKDINKVNYNGYVGCVTVPTGFVVVRRNNRVAISGNTGGMGAYSPAPILDGMEEEMENKIIKPFLEGINQEGIDYRGVLYVGLMKTKDGLKILEFNCRFGDPETQVILPRMKTDILEVMNAVIDGKLDKVNLEWHDNHCVSVVLASGGYPGSYEKGKKITGLDVIIGAHVIHAGTKKENGNILTNGGRVLNVVSLGKDLKEAVNGSYSAIPKINFEGMFFRKDIAKKELDRQDAK